MNTVATEMIKYYAGDKKRINHLIKVHGYAKAIGEAEELDERTMLILETAAYVHDIGIKISEKNIILLRANIRKSKVRRLRKKCLRNWDMTKTLSNVCHTLSVIITHIQISTVSTIKYLLKRTSLSI